MHLPRLLLPLGQGGPLQQLLLPVAALAMVLRLLLLLLPPLAASRLLCLETS